MLVRTYICRPLQCVKGLFLKKKTKEFFVWVFFFTKTQSVRGFCTIEACSGYAASESLRIYSRCKYLYLCYLLWVYDNPKASTIFKLRHWFFKHWLTLMDFRPFEKQSLSLVYAIKKTVQLGMPFNINWKVN